MHPDLLAAVARGFILLRLACPEGVRIEGAFLVFDPKLTPRRRAALVYRLLAAI